MDDGGDYAIIDGEGHIIGEAIHRVGTSTYIDAKANATLWAAAPNLLEAMPSLPHPGGRLIKAVAHYEDGSTQTIDGDVIASAIAKARGER